MRFAKGVESTGSGFGWRVLDRQLPHLSPRRPLLSHGDLAVESPSAEAQTLLTKRLYSSHAKYLTAG